MRRKKKQGLALPVCSHCSKFYALGSSATVCVALLLALFFRMEIVPFIRMTKRGHCVAEDLSFFSGRPPVEMFVPISESFHVPGSLYCEEALRKAQRDIGLKLAGAVCINRKNCFTTSDDFIESIAFYSNSTLEAEGLSDSHGPAELVSYQSDAAQTDQSLRGSAGERGWGHDEKIHTISSNSRNNVRYCSDEPLVPELWYNLSLSGALWSLLEVEEEDGSLPPYPCAILDRSRGMSAWGFTNFFRTWKTIYETSSLFGNPTLPLKILYGADDVAKVMTERDEVTDGLTCSLDQLNIFETPDQATCPSDIPGPSAEFLRDVAARLDAFKTEAIGENPHGSCWRSMEYHAYPLRRSEFKFGTAGSLSSLDSLDRKQKPYAWNRFDVELARRQRVQPASVAYSSDYVLATLLAPLGKGNEAEVWRVCVAPAKGTAAGLAGRKQRSHISVLKVFRRVGPLVDMRYKKPQEKRKNEKPDPLQPISAAWRKMRHSVLDTVRYRGLVPSDTVLYPDAIVQLTNIGKYNRKNTSDRLQKLVVYSGFGILVPQAVRDGNAQARTINGNVPQLACAGRQMLQAVVDFYKAGLLWMDLKPLNILFFENGAIVGDTGLVRTVGDKTTGPGPGTPGFRAPELVRLRDGSRRIHPSVTVYAFGAALYHMVHYRVPWSEDVLKKNADFELDSILHFPQSIALDIGADDLKDLLVRALDWDPERRITLAAVSKHRFWKHCGRISVLSVTHTTTERTLV